MFQKVFKKAIQGFAEDNDDYIVCFRMAITHVSIGNVKKSDKYFEQVIILLCKKLSASDIEFNSFPRALKFIDEYYVRPKIKNDSKDETNRNAILSNIYKNEKLRSTIPFLMNNW